MKWLKPAPGHLRIYAGGERNYDPDFVVEMQAEKLICEIKRASEMNDEAVLAKARAAVIWCEAATAHEKQHGGKPWRYLLIPHDSVTASATLNGLAAGYTFRPAR